MKAKCPSCGAWVNLEDDVDVGDQVECSDCEETLKVIHRNPPKLEFYYGDYENDDDEAEDQDEGKDEDW